ncbi:unnamed protein product [Effrenium voratum]|nr:unnamed protein product [Effrenium voratum]
MHLSTLQRAPKYSFRGVKDRFQTRGLRAAAQVPGPGSYGNAKIAPEVYSSRHRKSPGYGFGTGPREDGLRVTQPGPGTYPGAAPGSVGSGKAFSLTARRWPVTEEDNGSFLTAPGPGAHQEPRLNKGRSYSISPRRAAPKASATPVPGPAEYGTVHQALGMTKPKLPRVGALVPRSAQGPCNRTTDPCLASKARAVRQPGCPNCLALARMRQPALWERGQSTQSEHGGRLRGSLYHLVQAILAARSRPLIKHLTIAVSFGKGFTPLQP